MLIHKSARSTHLKIITISQNHVYQTKWAANPKTYFLPVVPPLDPPMLTVGLYLFSKLFPFQGRIQYSLKKGTPTLGGGGTLTYDFVKISKKLHEIEKILGRRAVP